MLKELFYQLEHFNVRNLLFISIIITVISCQEYHNPGISIKTSVTNISDSTVQISVLAQTFEDDELRDIHARINGSGFSKPYHPENFQGLHNLNVKGGTYVFDFVELSSKNDYIVEIQAWSTLSYELVSIDFTTP